MHLSISLGESDEEKEYNKKGYFSAMDVIAFDNPHIQTLSKDSRRLRRRKRRVLRTGIATFLCVSVTFFTGNFLHESFFAKTEAATLISPLATTPETAVLEAEEDSTVSEGLSLAVQDSLQGTHGTYGVYIENLKTSEKYGFNEHTVFTSGSLYKLWVMATVYDEIQNGTLSESTLVASDITTLNERFKISSTSAERTEGSISLTVGEATQRMITISDNYSALLLTAKVRLSKVDAFLKEHGFEESKIGTAGKNPTITASDAALFFKKLYSGQLADKETTEKMLQLLKGQRLNGKLPKHLPDSLVIAHKTGELDEFTHDAGIVYTPKGDYIISVLSSSSSPKQAVERIAEISQAVYTYISSKSE